MFEFPDVPGLEGQSITLMTGSAQRISVRLQRATTSQATQTEPLWPDHSWGSVDTGSHTFPKMKYRTERNQGLACGQHQVSSQSRKESMKPDPSTDGILHRGKVGSQADVPHWPRWKDLAFTLDYLNIKQQQQGSDMINRLLTIGGKPSSCTD